MSEIKGALLMKRYSNVVLLRCEQLFNGLELLHGHTWQHHWDRIDDWDDRTKVLVFQTPRHAMIWCDEMDLVGGEAGVDVMIME